MRWTFAILIAAVWIAGCAPICENEVSAAVRSPSGKMKAVVFKRGCGATVGFNTQVSVLSAEAALPNAEGNVLAIDGAVPLDVHWESDDSLQIAGTLSSRTFKQEHVVAGVRITYSNYNRSEKTQ
jgi:hypothetical protein